MALSPVEEGKLHLASYLRGTNRSLRDSVHKAAGLSEDGLAALLELTGQLEIYMPVEAHRRHWQGDGEVIVAAQLDEKVVPFGVDLDGQQVELSLETPPESPTISIVPAESFDKEGKPRARLSGGSEPQNAVAQVKRLVMFQVRITDDHEPWTKGDPEIYAWCTFPSWSAPTLSLDLPGVNKVNVDYTINQILGYYSDSYGNPATCGLSESDGIGSDDGLGAAQVPFFNPYALYLIPDGRFYLSP